MRTSILIIGSRGSTFMGAFRLKLIFVLFALLCMVIPDRSAAQSIPVGDPFETYYRLLSSDLDARELPSFHLRPAGFTLGESASPWMEHPWRDRRFFREHPAGQDGLIAFYNPELINTYNYRVPQGQNDGAIWQGVGPTHSISAGVRFRYGPLEVSLRPQFGYTHNHEFDLLPEPPFIKWPLELNEFAQGLARIDMPQRFGEDPFFWFHPGQSTARLRYSGAQAGISTANTWTGPALYNPLVMSNNAPGFLHAFVGTDGPVHTPAGNVEGRLFWGGLQESDWFDEDPGNNLRYITGLVFNYSPVFLPELDLGFSRTFVEAWPEEGLTSDHLLRTGQKFTAENFSERQALQYVYKNSPSVRRGDTAIYLLSIFMRWAVPDYGFEMWAEWGKNENTNDRRNFLLEPVHTRSYVLGFMKRFDLRGNRWFTLDFEMTQLENFENAEIVDYPVWYEHLFIPQGYTHRGQVLGAGIGPGSNNQRIGLNFYDFWGLAGVSLNRVIHHNDRLYRHQGHISRNQERILKDHWDHDAPQYASAHDLSQVEYRWGFHTLFFLSYSLELQADVYRSSYLNRDNIYYNDIYNTNLQFTLRYNLRGGLR